MAIGIKPATFSLFKSEDLANTGLSYKVKLRAMQVNFRMIIYIYILFILLHIYILIEIYTFFNIERLLC